MNHGITLMGQAATDYVTLMYIQTGLTYLIIFFLLLALAFVLRKFKSNFKD